VKRLARGALAVFFNLACSAAAVADGFRVSDESKQTALGLGEPSPFALLALGGIAAWPLTGRHLKKVSACLGREPNPSCAGKRHAEAGENRQVGVERDALDDTDRQRRHSVLVLQAAELRSTAAQPK